MAAKIASIAYAARTAERTRYYANDHSRDTVIIDAHDMPVINARGLNTSLDTEGFALAPHVSRIADFTDRDAIWSCHRGEIAALIKEQTGADHVAVNAPGVLRYSERSKLAGTLDNSFPARFAHVDVSDATAARFSAQAAPDGRSLTRSAHYNVWRAISEPPQDVPLAVCDARSVAAQDLIAADAIFDVADGPEWSFEGLVVAHNPDHRWHYFADMTRNEVIIFKTNDSLPNVAHCVPHVAFDDLDCPAEAPPRASIEMRATAYWLA